MKTYKTIKGVVDPTLKKLYKIKFFDVFVKLKLINNNPYRRVGRIKGTR